MTLTFYDLTEVFSYLKGPDLVSASLVCRDWRNAAAGVKRMMTKSLRIVPSTTSGAEEIDDDFIEVISEQKGATLEHLEVGYIPCKVSDIGLFSIGQCCAQLTSLNVSFYHMTNLGLIHIGNGCKNLTELTVNGVGEKCRMTDIGFSVIFEK